MRLFNIWLLLAAILLLNSCGGSASLGVKIDSELASYVPANSTLLAGVDADRLTAAPFYRRHSGQLNLPALNEMSDRIGLNPRRDLSSALVTWQGTEPLILTRGRFVAENIEAKLQQSGSKRDQYRNRTLFEANGDAVFFPNNNVAIGGPTDFVRKVIDVGNTGISPALKDGLRLLSADDQIWIVSSKGLPLEQTPLRADVRSAVGNIAAFVTAFNAGAAVGDGVQLHVDLVCDSADNARQVHDALRGGIGLARLTTKSDEPAMLKLYDAIHISYDQSTVHVQADLSSTLAEQLLALTTGVRQ